MADLLLEGISIAGVSSCHLRRSNRAKHMRIELRTDRSLLIVIPRGIREDQWLTFVLSKRSWIEKGLQHSSGHSSARAKVDIVFPNTIDLLCKQQRYEVSHKKGALNRAVVIADRLKLTCKGSSDKHAYNTLRCWLISQAREEFSARLDVIATDTGLEWNRLSVRGQKTRWGSCSAQGNISLNFKMLFLPTNLVNHVLLHELVHTREMNHSHRFWALMKQFDPGCDQHRAELRKAGQLLPDWIVKL